MSWRCRWFGHSWWTTPLGVFCRPCGSKMREVWPCCDHCEKWCSKPGFDMHEGPCPWGCEQDTAE